MENKYFVTYSWQDEDQPLIRKRNNCQIRLDSNKTDYWDFVDALAKQEYTYDKKDVVIEFMMKVGEE